MSCECNKLDSYLANDLPVVEIARFEGHLPQCDACREAIDQQRWIDDLLQSPLRSQLERPPVELCELARDSATRRRRIGRLAACGLAAAALLLIAIGWWELNRQAIGRVDPRPNRGDIAENVHVTAAAPLTATFVGGADVIAVPIESHYPDVTIVRIYPTYRPRADRRIVAADQNAATNSNWQAYSNGD